MIEHKNLADIIRDRFLYQPATIQTQYALINWRDLIEHKIKQRGGDSPNVEEKEALLVIDGFLDEISRLRHG